MLLSKYLGINRCKNQESKIEYLELYFSCCVLDTTLETFERIYIKLKNEVFVQYLLVNCKQDPNERVDQYLSNLKLFLSRLICSYSFG